MVPRTGDPQHGWNDRKVLHPRLYTVVKKRLCVVATSVPCERIFSKTGQTYVRVCIRVCVSCHLGKLMNPLNVCLCMCIVCM
jgi:hypothetical protein